MRECVVAVDLGGTNVRAAAYLRDGSLAGPRIDRPSRALEGAQATLDALAETIEQAATGSSAKPEAVGLAIPGVVDDGAGIVRWAPNFGQVETGVFQHWVDVDVRRPLEQRCGMRVRMGNDANLAALGEYKYGSGEGRASCLVMLTIGSGIGGGVILGQGSVEGSAGSPLMLLGGGGAGVELGHMLIQFNGADCRAGTYGSIEAYCQRDAIVLRAVRKLQRGRPSLALDYAGGKLAALTPAHLTAAADEGDEMAIEVYEEVGQLLGAGIGSAINVFSPDVFALGGQIAKAGRWLLGPAIKSARCTAIAELFGRAKIQIAQQLEDAGLLGAAAFAFGALDAN